MNELDCGVCQARLQGYLDQQLDPTSAAQVAAHLAACIDCARQYEQAQQLKIAVQHHAPYYPAPASLVARVLALDPAPPGLMQRWRTYLAPGFSAAALALAAVLYVATPGSHQALMDEAVSSHVRSLMGEHLNDVLSSDRHTVKPWFTGKLDFSPPVFDYSAQGFVLLGGRLDYLQHQATAALSYRRAMHIINVFILPTTEADTPRQSQTLRGYNLLSWQAGHMRYVLVSDVEKTELEAFSLLLGAGV